ncbi:nucleoside hydrolase [Galbibacter mesophilus]|uniref:nucleoside hydrolase n=1 Tax=Galbibacter mesophilus TaxID=379069 RepID=UPI00191EC49E|nr:nucleoside hydrolase [Galbibacter mesophilus]MCM5663877.1 nucleoside hydrolase [Galbibacter mesophilus]
MKTFLTILLCCLLGACSAPTRVIFDTDLDSDVDDVQALAMLHAYEKKGLIDLSAVIVTSRDKYAPGCADAINTFYGNGDTPVGFLNNGKSLKHFSKYTKEISEEFPHDSGSAESMPTALKVYRKTLSESPDNSVVLVTVGHLSSLQQFLQSPPDDISPLSGKELAEKKIKKWLCMGGTFPKGKEANFFRPDPASTVYSLDNWDKEVVFCGWEVGKEILTGGEYLKANLAKDNPVYRGFELYNNFAGRPAWDQVAVMLLDEKASSKYFENVSDGYVKVSADGSNEWIAEPQENKKHSYVKIKPEVSGDSIAREMDELILNLTE